MVRARPPAMVIKMSDRLGDDRGQKAAVDELGRGLLPAGHGRGGFLNALPLQPDPAGHHEHTKELVPCHRGATAELRCFYGPIHKAFGTLDADT